MRSLRFVLSLFLCCAYSFVFSQLTDDFSDGNFTASPAWSGDVAVWEVLANELHLNNAAPAANNFSYLSTPSAAVCNGVWEFHLRLNFVPSSTNLVDVFLVSDIANMSSTLNGYCVRLGGTNRQATLHSVTNGVKSPAIITGPANTLNIAAPMSLNVRVTRTGAGLWEVLLDNTAGNGTAYVSQGTGTSLLYTSGNYFGVSTTYTTTRNTWCFFDNITVTGTACPDTTKPTVLSVVPTSTSQATVTFSEKVGLATAQAPANYLLNHVTPPATATIMPGDTTKVLLDFGGAAFSNCGNDSMAIANVQDRGGNAMLTDTLPSIYFVPGTAVYKSVIFSEIMADPSPAPACVPAFEYLEIYNRSSFPVDLQNWKYHNGGAHTISAVSYPLCPGEYAILCANAANFPGYNNVIQVPAFGSLTNTGDQIGLRSATNALVDSVEYLDSWYQDVLKAAGGWSLELINPNDTCAVSSNWIASTDACGGTPSAQNSVYSLAPDLTPPSIVSVTVTGTNTLLVCFDESVTPVTANLASNYFVNNGLGTPTTAVVAAPIYTCVTLTFATPIDTSTFYTLTATGIEDCNGNAAATAGNFIISGPAAQRSLLINEIFFDPDPTATALPNVEYVELYNRSASTFDLSGWTFSDAGAPQTLGQYILAPGAYVILVDLADTAAYTGLPYLGMSIWPSLNNTGDALGLRDAYGNLVDSVDYVAPLWYQDPNKVDGGWSIELINPNDSCNTTSNWAASVDPDGGTPGAINSIFSTAPDLTAPTITSVTITGPNSVQVCFSEGLEVTTAATATNYSASNGLGTATSATPVGPTYTCVDLVFGTPITAGIVYTLTATGVEDCAGNTAPSSGTFLQSGPANWRALIINEIFFDPDTAATNLPNIEYVELYNRSTTPFDMVGWKFRDSGTPVTLGNRVLLPGEYLILCDENDTAVYSGLPYLGLSSWPSLNNTGDNLGLRDPSGNLVDSVAYVAPLWYHDPNRDGGGYSIELINPDDSCNAESNWRASIDGDGGTPGAINSVWSIAPDVTPPAVLSVTPTGPNSVQVCFDEAVDVATGGTPTNYGVDNGLGSPISATVIAPGNTCVDLTFALPIDTGTVYTLTATGVEDCSGNTAPSSGVFVLSGAAAFRAVVINEIFADPDPSSTSLPDVEYVELFNRSAQAFNLGGWTFHNSGRRVLGSFVLLPGEYVILCKESDTAAYTGIPYLGLVTWSSLTNGGDQLGLHDATGALIDTVQYDISMYQDPDKDDGGWSLELINPDDSCALVGNWIASNDSSGGTPGRQNSVYDPTPDVTAPTLVAATALDSNRVQICFDETMDLAAMLLASNYVIDNGIGSPVTVTVVPGSGGACVELLLAVGIDTGTVYTVTVSNMRDCKGNAAGALTGQFVLGGSANRYQVVINEIYPDESPVLGNLPEGEFLELYNNGPNVVNLAGWTVTDRRDTGTLPAFNLFPGAYVILCSSGNVGDYAAFGDAIAVSGMPGLNNDGDSLEIYDATGALMDLAYYDLSWYHDETKEDGGWSMERFDPTFSCMNGDNWRASTDANGATPGVVNSTVGTFADVEPPVMLSALVTSRTTIRVFFNELMDGSSLVNPANYTVDNGIGQATAVTVNGSLPFSIDLAFGVLMDTSQIYCLSVTGAQDCPGNTILTPNSVCFGIAAPIAQGDVILNEILFNPYTGGSDFVELYNNSDKIIDIAELNIGEIYPGTDSIFNGKAASTVPKLIFPRSYICITADKAHQLITYLPIDPDAIYEISSFPSYDDTEGECVVYTDSGLVLDRLAYLDDWSFPNLDDKNGVSLERLDFNRPTQDQNNWHSAASTALYATPGYKNSEILVPEGDAEVWLQPETFSPDQDGFEDILAINYHFTTPDWNVRVTVFDNKGRVVRRLQENTLVGTEQGTFTWDGTTDGLNKADVGVYVILLEGVNPTSGEKKKFRLGCVLAARL